MSEGQEVKITTAEKLCKAICGKTIDNVYCKQNFGSELVNKIRGSNVRYVETYGKNIIIAFFDWDISSQPYVNVGKMEDI
jgi:formamidopyrimidine-DNA glycosylase